jgi:hypothetical protein
MARHSALTCRLEVDGIEPDAHARDHPQPRGRGEDLTRDRLRARDPGVRVRDESRKLARGELATRGVEHEAIACRLEDTTRLRVRLAEGVDPDEDRRGQRQGPPSSK